MSNKTLLYLILASVVVMGVFFLTNFVSLVSPMKKKDDLFSAYDISGMAIVHHKQPFTLNFEQQNAVIEALNNALAIGSQPFGLKEQKPEFEKIVVYRFKEPSIDIIPLSYIKDNLVFSLSTDPGRQLRENTNGSLKKLLTETYDQ